MSNKPKFKIGDKVKVLPNGPQLEDYHGTWNGAMNHHIGKEYTIKKIFNPDIAEDDIGPFYGYSLKGTIWIFDERNLELVEQETTEKKPKFKVGDKVRVLPNGEQLKNYHGGWVFAMKSYIGKEYTIKKVVEPVGEHFYPFYGYLFEGSCWIFDERHLKLVKEKEENPANIIFKFKKNKIIAKREGGLKATASCHPDDTYDISFGMRLAVERLLDKEKKAKERKTTTPIEGFYICVKGNNYDFTYGNIYKFENGKIKDNNGWTFGPYTYEEYQKKNKTLYIGTAIFKKIKWEYA